MSKPHGMEGLCDCLMLFRCLARRVTKITDGYGKVDHIFPVGEKIIRFIPYYPQGRADFCLTPRISQDQVGALFK